MTSWDELAADHGLVRHAPARPLPPPAPATVDEVLRLGADPGSEALVGRWSRYTYGQLEAAVDGAAGLLAASGIGAGDRVGACLANHPDLVVAFLAAMQLGAIWVGINRQLAAPEKAHIARDAGVRLLLADPATLAAFGDRRAEVPDLAHLVALEPERAGGWWDDAPGPGRPRPPSPSGRSARPEADAPAAIAYTSGTTGRPKGVVHSHRNLLLPGAWRARSPRPGDTRAGVCLPLTILNLMILGPLTAFQQATTCVAMDRIDAQGVAAWVRDERLTSVTVPPAILHDLLRDPAVSEEDLAGLRYPGTGGTSLPDGLRDDFERRFAMPLTASYGLTEAPTAVTLSDPAAGPGAGEPGGSGRAVDYLDVHIRLPSGETAAPGGEGEICVAARRSGPWAGVYTPMLGYWDRPEATAAALHDGVLWTGDVGYLSPAGELHVTARKSDLIIRGGANVYPAEVEAALSTHPAVAAAAVIGLPDERLGERVVAVVEAAGTGAPSPDELRQLCGALLARYKAPEQFVVVDALPRNAMGKVVRAGLAALFQPG